MAIILEDHAINTLPPQVYQHGPDDARHFINAGEGDTATVSCDGVGGPGRFPLVRIVSRRFGRRAVHSPHSADLSTIVDKKLSNRVVRFARHKTQGKHCKKPHKTPHQQAYTRPGVPLWHLSAIRQHFSEQPANFIDCHPLPSHHIALILHMRRGFGGNIDELCVSSDGSLKPA